jgi:hypothetical protein
VTETPKYVIVGRGRWAKRMNSILKDEGRSTVLIEQARQNASESPDAYFKRLKNDFKSSGAQITWLCVPPGEHIPTVIEAAVEAKLHVVSEKPWLCSAEETKRLQARATAAGVVLAIHYEYCLLEAVQAWRADKNEGNGLRFGGRLHVNRADHIGLPALDNLGSHLFSVHEYAVSNSAIATIDCEYEKPDDRRIWLLNGDRRVAEIDLLANKEPIIQRFIAKVESAVRGNEFPFDLQFALRITERTAQWKS